MGRIIKLPSYSSVHKTVTQNEHCRGAYAAVEIREGDFPCPEPTLR